MEAVRQVVDAQGRLDRGASLLTIIECERTVVARCEADQLAQIVDFCQLHTTADPADAAAWPGQRSLEGRGTGAPIAGPGVPLVAVAAVHELTAALGISHGAGLALVGQALELSHRLPRLWSLVQELAVPAWQARQAAEATVRLSPAAADFADLHLASAARRGRLTRPTIRSIVQTAALRCEHDDATRVERSSRDERAVWFDPDESTAAVTRVSATLDTPAALALDASIDALATTLGRLGDGSSRQVRRATALGLLADPHGVLDLHAAVGGSRGSRAMPIKITTPHPASLPRSLPAAVPTLFVHIDAHDVESARSAPANHSDAPALVEKLGAVTLGLLHDWLAGIGRVTVQPVLEMARSDAVDRHDPPRWMQSLVILRDQTCVFPGCRIDARSCDLDHITPYDDQGPPGQTRPDNLALLCRRHHNAKTKHGWRYRRVDPGDDSPPGGPTYAWVSPLGRHFTVHVAGPRSLHRRS